jgi:hypothetical protein
MTLKSFQNYAQISKVNFTQNFVRISYLFHFAPAWSGQISKVNPPPLILMFSYISGICGGKFGNWKSFFCQFFGFSLSVSFHKDTTAMHLLPIRCGVTKQVAATINRVLKNLGQPIGSGGHEIFVTWKKMQSVGLGIT